MPYRASRPSVVDEHAGVRKIASVDVPSMPDFHAGDPCTGFHIVVYGQVKLGFHSPPGGEKVVESIGPGQSFGEALMFPEKPYIVFARGA